MKRKENKNMLTPCSPCICTNATCEQCMFGYETMEESHKKMKGLIEAVLAGRQPRGYGLAKKYMRYHADWRDQMGDNSDEVEGNV